MKWDLWDLPLLALGIMMVLVVALPPMLRRYNLNAWERISVLFGLFGAWWLFTSVTFANRTNIIAGVGIVTSALLLASFGRHRRRRSSAD